MSRQVRLRALRRSLALAALPLAFGAHLGAQQPTGPATPRPRVGFTGLLLVNGFYTSAKTNSNDTPLFADTLSPADPAGLPTSSVGAGVRQTRLGMTVTEGQALGARVTGNLEVDFFGGQLPSAAGRTSPLLRVRVATVGLEWANFGLLFGQDWTLLAHRNASSYAGFASPLFAAAGNLWARAPQARLTAATSGGVRVGLQAAALAPMQPLAQGFVATQPDSAERSGRPNLEGRAYLAWGRGPTVGGIGVAGHLGWLATAGDSLLQSRAVAADARIPFGRHIVLAGEAFAGRALGAFGGAVGQNLGPGGVPVRARGGWVQLLLLPATAWELGGGYGMDDPDDADLPLSGRGRNVAWEVHLTLRPGGGAVCGVEFRRLETTYAAGVLSANHVNAYAGLAF